MVSLMRYGRNGAAIQLLARAMLSCLSQMLPSVVDIRHESQGCAIITRNSINQTYTPLLRALKRSHLCAILWFADVVRQARRFHYLSLFVRIVGHFGTIIEEQLNDIVCSPTLVTHSIIRVTSAEINNGPYSCVTKRHSQFFKKNVGK